MLFINLLPACGGEQMSGVAGKPITYDKYVGDFVRIVQPQLLSMDSYPSFGVPGAVATQQGYRDNLAAMRRHSLAAVIIWSNL